MSPKILHTLAGAAHPRPALRQHSKLCAAPPHLQVDTVADRAETFHELPLVLTVSAARADPNTACRQQHYIAAQPARTRILVRSPGAAKLQPG